MKVKLLVTLFTAISLFKLHAQTNITVSVGAGYQNQAWYSFVNGVQSTQPKDNWDVAFEIVGYSAAILANTQKADFTLYKAPFSVLQWNAVDTAGIVAWQKLYNSDSSWAIGAFNQTINPADQFDLGWGNYNLQTHFVTGDSCYVVKVSATVYKKLMVENLANGSYNFTYADLDGNNEQQATIAKSDYAGKNFAYFDLAQNKALDREPLTSSWDLTFTRYTAMLSSGGTVIPYPVAGILQNKGVTVAQANNVPSVATYKDYSTHSFTTAINEIGYDWKTFDLASNQWLIVKDTCYFVKGQSGKIWKLIFSNFGGSTSGDFVFAQEELTTTGIVDDQGMETARFIVYPNPIVGEQLEVLFGSETLQSPLEVSIADMDGRVHRTEQVSLHTGISKMSLDVTGLQQGMYVVVVTSNAKKSIQKFIKQ